MLLWLATAMPSAAAHAPRPPHVRSHGAHHQTVAIKKLARQTLSVGRNLVRIRKVSVSLLTRRAHFQRAVRTVHADDDDAISNDAPAAYFDVDPILELRAIGPFVVVLEQQSFTFINSTRAPRGPPATA